MAQAKHLILIATLMLAPCLAGMAQNPIRITPDVPEVRFGRSISLSGDRMLVSTTSSNAYMFEWDGNTWIQTATLTPSDSPALDFGVDVAVHGNYAVVGAIGNAQGAAYVFQKNDSTWTEIQKLTASDGFPGDSFGFSVAIGGNRVFVSASQIGEYNIAGVGATYIFDLEGEVWTESGVFVDEGLPISASGGTLAYSEGRIATTLIQESFFYSGFVSVYSLEEGNWIEAQRIRAMDMEFFFLTVDIYNDHIVYGNLRYPADCGPGLAEVFSFDGQSWISEGIFRQDIDLGLNCPNTSGSYGTSVSIYGNYFAVSAPGEMVDESHRGVVYLYEWDGRTWNQISKITAGLFSRDRRIGFGSSITLDENRLLVSVPGDTLDGVAESGAVYLFDIPSIVESENENEDTPPPPLQLRLYQNYPNPFSQSTIIEFDIPGPLNARLAIYDLLGREVAQLVDRTFDAGTYSIPVSSTNLSNGMYVYRLETEQAVLQESMVLLK